jgi:antitoxin component of MazEF toxin-antitoxin module
VLKKIQKIGNSRGIVLEKPLLRLLNAENADHIELVTREDGLLIRIIDVKSAYSVISQKHRKSLDKLGE